MHPKKITEKHVVSVSFAFSALSDKWKSKWTHSLIENKFFTSIYSLIYVTCEAFSIFSLRFLRLLSIYDNFMQILAKNLWWIYKSKLIILSLYNCLNIKLQNDDLKSLLSQFGSTRCFFRFHKKHFRVSPDDITPIIGDQWTVLGQSGRPKKLKVDVLRKWTVLISKSGRTER